MFVTVDGVRLHYEVDAPARVTASTPSLVAVHGGPGLDLNDVRGSLAPLSSAARVFSLDLRGHGRSDRGRPDAWNLAQWARDLRGFCDALGLVRPVVFGNSFGGFVALAYAVAFPDHPGGLVLHATAARFEREATVAAFHRLGGAPAAAAARAFFLAPSDRTLEVYAELCLPWYRVRRLARPASTSTLRRDVALHFLRGEWSTFDLRPDLGRVRCPVLALSGEDDPVFPAICADAVAQGLPGARSVRLERCRHALLADAPEIVRGEVSAFVGRVAG